MRPRASWMRSVTETLALFSSRDRLVLFHAGLASARASPPGAFVPQGDCAGSCINCDLRLRNVPRELGGYSSERSVTLGPSQAPPATGDTTGPVSCECHGLVAQNDFGGRLPPSSARSLEPRRRKPLKMMPYDFDLPRAGCPSPRLTCTPNAPTPPCGGAMDCGAAPGCRSIGAADAKAAPRVPHSRPQGTRVPYSSVVMTPRRRTSSVARRTPPNKRRNVSWCALCSLPTATAFNGSERHWTPCLVAQQCSTTSLPCREASCSSFAAP